LKESNETGSVPDLAFSKKRATLLENNLWWVCYKHLENTNERIKNNSGMPKCCSK
jgi:hypothetical protein